MRLRLTRRQSHPTTPRLLTVAVVGLVTVLASTGCGGRQGNGPSGPAQPAPSISSSTGTPSATATARWQWLPAAPVDAPIVYSSVWTGTELLVLGLTYSETTGIANGTVAAAYNPATNVWRSLPPSPYEVKSIEGGESVIWNGTEMLAFGRMSAAFNPTSNRWRSLRAAPVTGSSVLVSAGRQVLTWGGGCCGDFSASGSVYNVASDTWQPMPASPLTGRWDAYGVWTGTELLVIGGNTEGSVLTDAGAYNPLGRRWRSLPPMPAPRAGATAVWTGTEVLIVGGHSRAWPIDKVYADGVAFNPVTNRWRTLPSSPISRYDHMAVWTGSRLLVWGGQTLPRDAETGVYSTPPHGMIFDPVTGTWSAMPVSVLRGRTRAATAWTGSEMLIWGGAAVKDDVYLVDGAAFRPAA
jgi:Kelch motif protein